MQSESVIIILGIEPHEMIQMFRVYVLKLIGTDPALTKLIGCWAVFVSNAGLNKSDVAL